MYTEVLESKAQRRWLPVFQKFQYGFVLEAVHMNSTILRFYQMSHGITTLCQPIFVTATISHEGAEFK